MLSVFLNFMISGTKEDLCEKCLVNILITTVLSPNLNDFIPITLLYKPRISYNFAIDLKQFKIIGTF